MGVDKTAVAPRTGMARRVFEPGVVTELTMAAERSLQERKHNSCLVTMTTSLTCFVTESISRTKISCSCLTPEKNKLV